MLVVLSHTDTKAIQYYDRIKYSVLYFIFGAEFMSGVPLRKKS